MQSKLWLNMLHQTLVTFVSCTHRVSHLHHLSVDLSIFSFLMRELDRILAHLHVFLWMHSTIHLFMRLPPSVHHFHSRISYLSIYPRLCLLYLPTQSYHFRGFLANLIIDLRRYKAASCRQIMPNISTWKCVTQIFAKKKIAALKFFCASYQTIDWRWEPLSEKKWIIYCNRTPKSSCEWQFFQYLRRKNDEKISVIVSALLPEKKGYF